MLLSKNERNNEKLIFVLKKRDKWIITFLKINEKLKVKFQY